MSLKQRVEEEMKAAMKSQNKDLLRALRGIKSLILLAETEEGNKTELSAETEMKLLLKAAKQRRDSAEMYAQQNRPDLEKVERDELAVIERFLPQMLTGDELKAEIQQVIAQVGATSAKEMGKVMGAATKALQGKADNKAISEMVKQLLS
jgi:uncharacterized protein YqeY